MGQKDSSSAHWTHDLEVKMRDFFNSKGLKIEPWIVTAMGDTFEHQRQIVKSSVTGFDLTSRYPFLCTSFFFLRHFEELTSSRLQDQAHIFIAKFERLLKFFNSTSTSKGKMGSFWWKLLHLNICHTVFMMESPGHTVQDIEAKSLPPTPRLILRGNSLMEVEGWMLSIEGKVVIHADTQDQDFLKTIGCLFTA
ncbi:unnamed protein product [Lymnaea stagnalis]|uniref:Uncharacterized protein n=1 Tax=Lymnaea stagnalis TaxID=6523 RepID=A0AAV2HZH6_LYMST